MRRRDLLIPLGIVTLFMAGYVFYPLIRMGVESLASTGGLSLKNYRTLIDPANQSNLEAIRNSVVVSLLSVAFSALVGTFLAFVLTQFDFPFRRTLSRFAIIPIALPPLVGVIAFLLVFGESGIFPRSLAVLTGISPAKVALDGIPAIVAIHVYSFNIYFYLLATSAFRAIDASTLEAAAVLGSGSWKIFRKVILPQLRPALVGGSVLTFMASMASFSAPYIFGGARRFLTVQILATKLNGDMELAAAQSFMLMMVSVAFFVLLSWFTWRGSGGRATKGAVRPGRLPLRGPSRSLMVAVATMIVLLELLPLAVIVLVSCAKEGSWTWQILPAQYTLDNYMMLLNDPNALNPILNSLGMAFLATIAAVIIGVSGAVLLSGPGATRGRVALDTLLTFPYAIPGTVVALALILAFNSPSLPAGNAILVGTYWILPLAYIVRTYPMVHRATSAALSQFDSALTEAAGTLGAGPLRQWRTVVLPIILPAVLSGALLVLIAALGEFVSSILLYSYSSRPISVEILAQMRNFNFGAAAAYSVILLLLTLGCVSLSNRLSDRPTFPVS